MTNDTIEHLSTKSFHNTTPRECARKPSPKWEKKDCPTPASQDLKPLERERFPDQSGPGHEPKEKRWAKMTKKWSGMTRGQTLETPEDTHVLSPWRRGGIWGFAFYEPRAATSALRSMISDSSWCACLLAHVSPIPYCTTLSWTPQLAPPPSERAIGARIISLTLSGKLSATHTDRPIKTVLLSVAAFACTESTTNALAVTWGSESDCAIPDPTGMCFLSAPAITSLLNIFYACLMVSNSSSRNWCLHANSEVFAELCAAIWVCSLTSPWCARSNAGAVAVDTPVLESRTTITGGLGFSLDALSHVFHKKQIRLTGIFCIPLGIGSFRRELGQQPPQHVNNGLCLEFVRVGRRRTPTQTVLLTSDGSNSKPYKLDWTRNVCFRS